MKIPPYTITPEQLAVHKGIQTILMAWIALITALLLFTGVLAAFLYALFVLKSEGSAKTILGATDLTLGVALRGVYAYLFPTPKS